MKPFLLAFFKSNAVGSMLLIFTPSLSLLYLFSFQAQLPEDDEQLLKLIEAIKGIPESVIALLVIGVVFYVGSRFGIKLLDFARFVAEQFTKTITQLSEAFEKLQQSIDKSTTSSEHQADSIKQHSLLITQFSSILENLVISSRNTTEESRLLGVKLNDLPSQITEPLGVMFREELEKLHQRDRLAKDEKVLEIVRLLEALLTTNLARLKEEIIEAIKEKGSKINENS